jgi:glycosyltransferase involved in cell wall biosynthesis
MTIRQIGIITRHAFPTAQEVRVERLSRTLSQRGHSVTIFCPMGSFKSALASVNNSKVVRLKPRLSTLIGQIIYIPLPINPIWTIWFCFQFRRKSLNIVVVRDLRLALPAIAAARYLSIPLVLDIGEHYPGMMTILGKQKLVHYIIRNHYLISWLEKWSVKLADYVWVVVAENKKRLSKYNANISVISNFPEPSQQHDSLSVVEPTVYTNSGPPIRLVSFGLIDNIRGLDLAIDAFALVIKVLQNCELVIYGDGFYRHQLVEQVKALRLEEKVRFAGWVAAENKYQVLADGDIGLILHKQCDLTHHTIPNKLFDYMKVGLPIISTSLSPVEQVINREQCGIIVEESAIYVSQAIQSLIMNVEQRRAFSRNGICGLNQRYRWSDEEEKILRDLDSLIHYD